MGIRPNLLLMCGLVDVQAREYEIVDPRYEDPGFVDGYQHERIPLPEIDIDDTSISNMSYEQFMKHSSEIMIRDFFIDREKRIGKEGYEFIEFDPEYCDPCVCGISLSSKYDGYQNSLYDRDEIWALASVLDVNHRKVFLLPDHPLEEDSSPSGWAIRTYRTIVKNHGRDSKEAQEYREIMKKRRYRYEIGRKARRLAHETWGNAIFSMSILNYMEYAMYGLKWMGWKGIRWDDLKLFLYLKWS